MKKFHEMMHEAIHRAARSVVDSGGRSGPIAPHLELERTDRPSSSDPGFAYVESTIHMLDNMGRETTVQDKAPSGMEDIQSPFTEADEKSKQAFDRLMQMAKASDKIDALQEPLRRLAAYIHSLEPDVHAIVNKKDGIRCSICSELQQHTDISARKLRNAINTIITILDK